MVRYFAPPELFFPEEAADLDLLEDRPAFFGDEDDEGEYEVGADFIPLQVRPVVAPPDEEDEEVWSDEDEEDWSDEDEEDWSDTDSGYGSLSEEEESEEEDAEEEEDDAEEEEDDAEEEEDDAEEEEDDAEEEEDDDAWPRVLLDADLRAESPPAPAAVLEEPWAPVPCGPPAPALDVISLGAGKRHRDDDEEEDSSSKRPRLSADEPRLSADEPRPSSDEPRPSTSAGTSSGCFFHFQLLQDSDSDSD